MVNICKTPTKAETGEVASPTDDEVAAMGFETPVRVHDATTTALDHCFVSLCEPKTAHKLATSRSGAPTAGGVYADEADVCPICLEDLHHDRGVGVISTNEESEFVETRCKHVFHKKCLLAAKLQHKSECPCCRSLLTPPPTSAFLNLDPANGPVAQAQERGLGPSVIPGYTSYSTGAQYPASIIGMQAVNRHAIIAASSRGREAVRRSLQLRYLQQQQQQPQQPVLSAS